MDKKRFFIVWNGKKNEGFITDNQLDALDVAEGEDFGCPNSTVGEAFRETYDGQALSIQEIEIEV